MKPRFLALLTAGITCFGVASCSSSEPTNETTSSVPSGQPVEIKPDDQGWLRMGNLSKYKDGNVKVWQYGKIFLTKIFFLDDGGFENSHIRVGPTSKILSVKREQIDGPYLTYNCSGKTWYFNRGKTLDNMIDKNKDKQRVYLKVNGKYTGYKPWGKSPWPTTGYDPSKSKWVDKFVGKSQHGIDQAEGKNSEIATLVASHKSAVVVAGTEDEKVMYKFEFDAPPDQLDKKALCEFAIDGKAIIPAT